jgi:hypothetical protein
MTQAGTVDTKVGTKYTRLTTPAAGQRKNYRYGYRIGLDSLRPQPSATKRLQWTTYVILKKVCSVSRREEVGE